MKLQSVKTSTFYSDLAGSIDGKIRNFTDPILKEMKKRTNDKSCLYKKLSANIPINKSLRKKTDVGVFHYLHLSLSILCYFLLMNFQWKSIWIMEKCHFLSGIIIQAYRLCFNSFPIQFFYCIIYTLNFKCQMA